VSLPSLHDVGSVKESVSPEFSSIRTEFEVGSPEVKMGPPTAAQMNLSKTVLPPPADEFIK
jgi:hypothetical protein